MKEVKLGSVEMGEDSIFHSAYPHLTVSFPITPGTAYPQGTMLQIDTATSKLEASDLTARVYVAVSDILATADSAEVGVLGAVRSEVLKMPSGAAPTLAQIITMMEKSPLAVI